MIIRIAHVLSTIVIDDGAEDPGEYLTALITSAVHDETPQYTLNDIYSAVANAGAAQNLVRPSACLIADGSDLPMYRMFCTLYQHSWAQTGVVQEI